MEMADSHPAEKEQDAVGGAEQYHFTFMVPSPSYPVDTYPRDDKRLDGPPLCRIRRGRGGRMHLETKRNRMRGAISRGVVSDSESDDDVDDYYPVSEVKAFDYRCAMNNRPRSDGSRPSGDQATIMAGAQAAVASQAQQAAGGSTS